MTGRPTKYDSSLDKQVYKLSLLGLTDKELAGFLEIAESTLNEWKLQHASFSESIKRGKDEADAKVVAALYKRACGFTKSRTEQLMYKGNKETVVLETYYPPDPVSCIYWLNNRQRSKWSNKVELEQKEPLKIAPIIFKHEPVTTTEADSPDTAQH